MKVAILCGGQGTRLREKTESMPKPLVEIGGKPILWHIMKIYAHYGFSEFVLCLGYKGRMIEDYFKQAPEPWKITFADTGEATQTGGRVKKIEKLITEENFMVTYGDGVADIDIRKLVEFHQKHGRIGTVSAVNPPSQFGLLDLAQDGTVKRFQEKPQTNQWINGGFFVFKKEFFKFLSEESVLEKQPLEKLAVQEDLRAFRHESFWKCMDTYKDTVVLNEHWADGKAPWKVWAESGS